MDTAVMSDVRGQRGSSPASCAGLQSRQFPAHFGDAGADQRLVDDDLEREAHQDRREGREPRPLCRVSDGRSRHSQKSLRRHLAAHRGTATAARCGARVKHSFVMRHGKLTGGLCPNDEKKRRRAPSDAAQAAKGCQKPSRPACGLQSSRKQEPSVPVRRSSGGF
jgi:hypothetical protein